MCFRIAESETEEDVSMLELFWSRIRFRWIRPFSLRQRSYCSWWIPMAAAFHSSHGADIDRFYHCMQRGEDQFVETVGSVGVVGKGVSGGRWRFAATWLPCSTLLRDKSIWYSDTWHYRRNAEGEKSQPDWFEIGSHVPGSKRGKGYLCYFGKCKSGSALSPRPFERVSYTTTSPIGPDHVVYEGK
jgi:hypothetical protein